MVSEKIRVSVLMPVYKTDERFLRAAIESVLSQSMRDFELLILDDCPECSREAVVSSFDDKRIIYFKNERNLGITPSRNRLLKLARGEYLAVFDHDDVCRQDRLEKQCAYLDAHPECGVVASWTAPLPKGDINRYPSDDHEICVSMMNGCTLWHPSAMIRKSVLTDHHIQYEEEFSPVEDYMLFLKLIQHTRFHNIEEPLISYRWHENNTTVLHRDKLNAQVLRCRAWAKVHLPELWAEFELRKENVKRVKLLGLPILKIETEGRWTTVKLFNALTIATIYEKECLR